MKVALLIGLCCGLLSGCAMPGVVKLAKPAPKISQEEFTCGEKCPPSLKAAPVR